jgi:aquaporin Z
MKKYITEFIGTFFFILIIGLSIFTNLGSFAPLTIGSGLMIMVYAGGHISGAHYNPAVTLAVFLRKRLTGPEVGPYMISQVLAAILAAFLVRYFVSVEVIGDKGPNPEPFKALLAELLGTFVLAYVVLNVATAKANAGNSYFGLAIGFTITVMVYTLGVFSGGAFNPAVAIGICFMHMDRWGDLWIYLVGAFGGSILAALVFNMLNPDDK